MAFFDSFSGLDNLNRKDRRDYEKVKACILAAGRFSAFDDSIIGGKMLTRICRDPDLVIDNKSVGYPWTLVRKRLKPEDFAAAGDAPCDSGSDPEGENPRSGVEGEASQSGAAKTAHRPKPIGNTPTRNTA